MLYGFQKEIIKHPRVVVCAPRQIGKTHSLCVRAQTDTFDVIISAQDKENAKKILRQYKQLTKLDGLAMRTKNFFEKSVEVVSSKPDSQAGRTASVIIDEFALHPQQEDLMKAQSPVSQKSGRMAILSTPRNRTSLFYDLLMTPLGKEAGFHQLYYNVYDLLPNYIQQFKDILKDYQDKEAQCLSYLKQIAVTNDQWKREFECKFDEDSSVLISYALQQSCYKGDISSMSKDWASGLKHKQLGIDIGRTHDNTVIFLSGLDQSGHIISVELFSKTGVPFLEQKEIISNYINYFKTEKVYIDATGIGQMLSEVLFHEHSSIVTPVTFVSSATDVTTDELTRKKKSIPKGVLAENVKATLEQHDVSLFGNKDLCASINSIKKTYSSSGNTILYEGSYKDHHCDNFWQLALSLFRLKTSFHGAAKLI